MPGKSSSTDTKKKKKGRNKGSPFERLIAKRLSLWASHNTSDDWVWRTSGSGARAKIRSNKGKKTAGAYGDLKAEHPKASFLFLNTTFELKIGYKNWCVLDVIDKPKLRSNQKNVKEQTFSSFCSQAEEDTRNAEATHTVIITKKDKREIMIWLEFSVFKKFFSEQIKNKTVDYVKIVAAPNKTYAGITLDMFLDHVSPEKYNEIMNGGNDENN